MIIHRNETVTVFQHKYLKIDEQMAEDLTAEIREHLDNPDEFKPLTVQDLEAFAQYFYGDYSENYRKEILHYQKYCGCNEDLVDYIEDYFEDTFAYVDPKIDDCETEWYSTEVRNENEGE